MELGGVWCEGGELKEPRIDGIKELRNYGDAELQTGGNISRNL